MFAKDSPVVCTSNLISGCNRVNGDRFVIVSRCGDQTLPEMAW